MSDAQEFRYLSICSGLEAATLAWAHLGWKPAAFSEIEAFPRAVLNNHYPDVPLHGDFTTIKGDEYGKIDLICGGTPCQDYSIAGTRQGLDGERGQLTLEFSRLAYRCDAKWLLWENVPGALSSNGGADFGAVLATFAGYPTGHVFHPEGGGKWGNSGIVEPAGPNCFGLAWRVLDLQYFGIPQRRRRIVLVGYLGGWRRASAVLFEPESLRGDSAPSREKGQSVAALTANGVGTCGADDNQGQGGHLVPCGFGGGNTSGEISVATTLAAKGQRLDFDQETFIADPIAFAENSRNEVRLVGGDGKITGALSCGGGKPGQGLPAVAVSLRGRDGGGAIEIGYDQSNALRASQGGGDKPHMFDGYAVRRLIPRECERLMDMPDDYTRIPYRKKPEELCPDGPRYKAIGNSWGVAVFRWVGERIKMVEAMK